jgi:hypothetical protein
LRRAFCAAQGLKPVIIAVLWRKRHKRFAKNRYMPWRMPRAEIALKQAVYTLGLPHAELAGKLLANKREVIRLRTAMLQAGAVVKTLQPWLTCRARRPFLSVR